MTLTLKGVRSAVIVAPHPDDEIIGAAALIAALRRQGSTVRVIIVSDGAASHPTSLSWPRARLVAARRRESLHGLARLGVRRDDVTFLGLPDGELSAGLERCRYTIGRAIARNRRIDLLVGPALSDAHPDHRAVADALDMVRSRPRYLTYRVWPPQGRVTAPMRSIVMPSGAAAKRSLIRSHRTQLGAITDDPKGFTIAPHELRAFAHPVERFVERRR